MLVNMTSKYSHGLTAWSLNLVHSNERLGTSKQEGPEYDFKDVSMEGEDVSYRKSSNARN